MPTVSTVGRLAQRLARLVYTKFWILGRIWTSADFLGRKTFRASDRVSLTTRRAREWYICCPSSSSGLACFQSWTFPRRFLQLRASLLEALRCWRSLPCRQKIVLRTPALFQSQFKAASFGNAAVMSSANCLKIQLALNQSVPS